MVKGIRLIQSAKGARLAQLGQGARLIQQGNAANLISRGSRLPGATAIKGFADFIKNGNIVDLAVAVVIGTAFAALVTQFTNSFLTPLIAVTTGGGDVGGQFSFNGQDFTYGAFIGAIITFLNTTAVIYFLVIVPMNKLLRRSADVGRDQVATEVDLLKEIRDLLRAEQQQRSAPPD
ncbi:MAG: large conductance mechanosensitive channel protein MscL [Pseudonocardiales bacterium]